VKRTQLKRHKPMRSTLRRPPMDGDLRTSIIERAEYRCDLCCKALSPERWQCHHRQLRAQLGPDHVANLLALHTRCHEWIHNNPQWGYAHGFMVPAGRDFLVWQVHRFRTLWMAPRDTWVLSRPHPDQLEACADA
jgi:hypothetical protein